MIEIIGNFPFLSADIECGYNRDFTSMRHRQIKKMALLLGIYLQIACVSVDLKREEVEKSGSVNYEAPNGPFESFDADHVDKAWRNSKNGNTISYISECSSGNDPSHEAIKKGVLSGIHQVSELSNEMFSYNNRKALRSRINGTLDGVSTTFDIIVLKKNGCIFVITYIGLTPQFQDDLRHFDTFVSKFEAP